MKQDINKIKERIRALLNVAQNDASTDGEIENALSFAKSLMLRYHLESDDLPDNNDNPHAKAAEKEIKDLKTPTTGKTISSWESALAVFTREFIGSVGVYVNTAKKEQKTQHGTIKFDDKGQPKVGQHITFYGAWDEVELAIELFEEISLVVSVMARMKYGSLLRGKGRSYAEGFINGLSSKLKNATENLEQHTESRGLITQTKAIIAHKQERNVAWLKAKNIRLGSAISHSGQHNSDAFNSGKKDGANYSPQKRTANPKLN